MSAGIRITFKELPLLRWGQYLLFWSLSFFILSRYFAYQNEVSRIDVIYTFLFHLSILGAVIINSFFLVPKFLAKKRYVLYGLLFIITLLAGTWLNILTFRYLADWLFPGYYFISYYGWFEISQFILTYLVITTLLQLSGGWFREAEIRQKLAETEQARTETELKALKAQINPHFLFNSLNHVYSLAVKQSSKTAPAILQLSDLLRYTIRNINEAHVTLQQEIEYINTYIELFKSRVKHPDRIHFRMQGDAGNLKIAPLLLLTFIENCFKHGSVKDESESIVISIEIKGDELFLRTKNSIEDHSTSELPEESSGLGLDNARKRLELMYPDRHSLDITTERNLFKLSLKIDLA
jgi:sensor histidine kinase YesM